MAKVKKLLSKSKLKEKEAALERRLRSIKSARRGESSEGENRELEKIVDAAALKAEFVPEEIAELVGVNLSEELTEHLRKISTVVETEKSDSFLSLSDSARRASVKRFFERPSTEQATVINQLTDSKDPYEQVLGKMLLGNNPAIADLDTKQLLVAADLNEQLSGVIDGFDQTQLDRALEKDAFKTSLKRLIGGKFAGRSSEMKMLNFYVDKGYIESSQNEAYRPLLIRGPGGMGKSTLLAHFLTEKVCKSEPPNFPFAYLDFDRRSLSIEYPATLLHDALRQLAIFYPDHRDLFLRLRNTWRKKLRIKSQESSRGTKETAIFSSAGATDEFVDEFARALIKNGIIRDQPLLLILDTFEEVQRRSRDYVAKIGRFLQTLHEKLGLETGLRVILSGRVEIEESNFLTHEHVLEALDKPASEAFLQSLGVHPTLTPKVVEQVKGIPLTLRLASDLIQKSQDELLSNADLASLHPVWDNLADDQIQGMIYRRYLEQIHDENVKKLAHPGLVLRFVTPELIEHVLQEPCGIRLAGNTKANSENDETAFPTAQKVFEDLANEVSLVSAGDGNVLKHRPEVRKVMLDLLGQDRPKDVRKIHELAYRYYEKLSESASVSQRAEEIYHRLQLSQPESKISERWISGVQNELRDCLDELPKESQLILASRLGQDGALEAASADDFEKIDSPSWERYAIRKAETSIKFNTPHEGLGVLAERETRLPGSELYVLESTLHKLDSNWARMREVAMAGMESAESVGNQKMANELVGLLVQSYHLQGDFAGAESAIRKARPLAKEGDSPESLSFHLQLDLAELEMLRTSFDESDFRIEELAVSRLKRLLAFKPSSEFAEICRRAAGALGGNNPEIVEQVMRRFPIEASVLNEPRILMLTEAFSRWDEVASNDRGEKPGFLAISNQLLTVVESFNPRVAAASEDEIVGAMLDAISNLDELASFFRNNLDVSLYMFTSSKNSLRRNMFDAVRYFQSGASLESLVTALKEEYPTNQQVRELRINQTKELSYIEAWEAVVRKFAKGKNSKQFAKLVKDSLNEFGLPKKSASKFADYFALPDESEAMSPAYSRLVEELDESELEELSQRVLSIDVLEKGDKAKTVLKQAYEHGRFQQVLETAKEIKNRKDVAATRTINQHKEKYIDVQGGEGNAWRALHKAITDAYPSPSELNGLLKQLDDDKLSDYLGPFIAMASGVDLSLIHI